MKNFDCGEIFGGALIFLWWWDIGCENIFFWKMWVLVAWVLVMEIDELKFCVAESQKSRQYPNVGKCKAALSPSIKNIINEAGFSTFFEALLNHETHEYKDL